MGARRIRREQVQFDQKKSRRINGAKKVEEIARREKRLVGMIKMQGKLPYSPVVMSWLSIQLDTPSRLITQEEVDRIVSAS